MFFKLHFAGSHYIWHGEHSIVSFATVWTSHPIIQFIAYQFNNCACHLSNCSWPLGRQEMMDLSHLSNHSPPKTIINHQVLPVEFLGQCSTCMCILPLVNIVNLKTIVYHSTSLIYINHATSLWVENTTAFPMQGQKTTKVSFVC